MYLFQGLCSLWCTIVSLHYILFSLFAKRKRPLFFSLCELLACPIWILKFKIFQHVFGGFMGFVCSSDFKIQKVREKLIGWKKRQSKIHGVELVN